MREYDRGPLKGTIHTSPTNAPGIAGVPTLLPGYTALRQNHRNSPQRSSPVFSVDTALPPHHTSAPHPAISLSWLHATSAPISLSPAPSSAYADPLSPAVHRHPLPSAHASMAGSHRYISPLQLHKKTSPGTHSTTLQYPAQASSIHPRYRMNRAQSSGA